MPCAQHRRPVTRSPGMSYGFEKVRTASREREQTIVRRTVKALADTCGVQIKGWRCPDYRISPQTFDVLSAEGFDWDSSMLNDDLPYLLDCEAGPLVEIPFTTSTRQGLRRFPYPMRGGPAGSPTRGRTNSTCCTGKANGPRFMILSMQTWATGRPAPLRTLKQFLERVTTHNDVQFARCSEIAGWCKRTAQAERNGHGYVEGSRTQECRDVAHGVRLPIIISVHHQSEEACVMFADGQPDPFDFNERQYGGRRGAWRLLEIMAKHSVLGTWIICGATCEKYPGDVARGDQAGHSIAGHGYEHEMMCDLPPHEELELIRKTVRSSRTSWESVCAAGAPVSPATARWTSCSSTSISNGTPASGTTICPISSKGTASKFMEIPFSVYSDAAYSKNAGNPCSRSTRSAPGNEHTRIRLPDHEGSVRRALRARRRTGGADAA